jgi:dihydropteroate synthase
LMQVAAGIGQALPAEPEPRWHTARGELSLERPVLVGILNVTPDSFSDGGRFAGTESALQHAHQLLQEGAAILDVGGESTRPGRSESVSADEELRRVVPVIDALVREHPSLLISVDTAKSDVARAALDAGAAVVNDVSAFRLDPEMASTVARAGAGVVLMHSRGSILEIASYAHADYAGDVVGAVLRELRDALARAAAAGIAPEATVVDPGFGFSKTVPQNMELLDQLAALQALGRPILVGPSRKRFLGAVSGLSVEDRDRVTATACALAAERGARLFRVHSVAPTREALSLVQPAESTG